MCFEEVDEISDEDLEAVADYHARLLNDTLPHKQAERIAAEQFGVVLPDNVLNRIMEMYACTTASIDECVIACLKKPVYCIRLSSISYF